MILFGGKTRWCWSCAGYASDNGKMYDSLTAAKAVCSRDIRCGGVLSRSCDEQSNGTSGCKHFQTRSGMSEEGCHAGVPCANRRPHTLPEPPGTGWQEQQNSNIRQKSHDLLRQIR